MPYNMGIGQLGSTQLIFKRKFRWTFNVTNICSGANGGAGNSIPEYFVKVAGRPGLDIEETEINFMNGKTFLPGKGTWDTIDVTYYDVASQSTNTGQQALYSWLASVYNFTNPVTLQQGGAVSDYSATGNLVMYDGCGNPLEQWVLWDMWPKAIKFGELDYASSEEADITLTLRFAAVSYYPLCPTFAITPCCTGCTGGSLQNPANPFG